MTKIARNIGSYFTSMVAVLIIIFDVKTIMVIIVGITVMSTMSVFVIFAAT